MTLAIFAAIVWVGDEVRMIRCGQKELAGGDYLYRIFVFSIGFTGLVYALRNFMDGK